MGEGTLSPFDTPLGLDLTFNETIGEIGEITIFENISIRIVEPQTVMYGTIIFKNVTMFVDHDVSSTHYLINMGKIVICDLDNDPSTSIDASVVNGNSADLHIINYQGQNGEMIVENSFMNDLSCGNQGMEGSIFLNSSRVTNLTLHDDGGDISIIGSTFVNSLIDVRSCEIDNTRLIGSSIVNMAGGSINDTHFIGMSILDRTALKLRSSSMVTVGNSKISGYDTAVFHEFEGLELKNTSIYDCKYGIKTMDGTRVYLDNCEIFNTSYPIDSFGLISMGGSLIRNGTIKMNDHSLVAVNSFFREMESIEDIGTGQIKNCTFKEMGIAFDSPMGVTTTGSDFVDCDIVILNPVSCLFYHNSFIRNKNDVMGIPSSDWYNSDLKEGNYYSTYSGKDDGSSGRDPGDGIGDTDIPYLGRDLYPFMKDSGWDMPKIFDLTLVNLKGSGTVNLSWTSTDADGYIVQRSAEPDFSTSLVFWTVTTDRISIVNNPNSTQYFRAAAFNDAGYRGWSNVVSVLIDQAPLPPSSVDVEQLDEGKSLRVTWEHVGEDIAKTFIFFSPVGGQVSYNIIPYPERETYLTDLKNGIVYNISFATEDGIGQISSLSENYTGIPIDIIPPPPPRSLRGDSKTNTTFDLYWDPPLVQDISHYEILRKGPDLDIFISITIVPSSVFMYTDKGLRDNTTYTYAVRAIDDDGPLSELSVPLTITTLHNNQPPLFNGIYSLIELKEDQAPHSIDIDDLVSDPDGDVVIVLLEDSYRVRAELIDHLIWIIPSPDQAGNGFVKVLASDGEVTSFFYIGIFMEEVSDPPTGVKIISPLDGAVITPGSRVLLHADAFDPDIPYGDNLTYIWTSDKDGPLNRNGSLLEHHYAILSPGLHNITLLVMDENGTGVERSISLMVSLWGYGEIPWRVELLEIDPRSNGGRLTIRIENDAPFQLTFFIDPDDLTTSDIVGKRTMLIGPSSYGDIVIEMIPPLKEGSILELEWSITAETLNGTYAGERMLNGSAEVRAIEEDPTSQILIFVLIVIAALVAIIGAIGVIILSRSSRSSSVNEKIQEEETVGPDVTGGENDR